MHSFHPSRGRILFEVFCALAISASFVGAWKQTGAWTLLPAALAAAVYALFHAFDMVGPKRAAKAEPQRIDFATDEYGDVLVDQPVEAPLAAVSPEPAVEQARSEPVALEQVKARKAKAPRKPRVRAKAAEPEMAPALDEAAASEGADLEDFDFDVPPPSTEQDYPRIEPLFEPEPYFRQKRAAFGRRHTLR